MIIKKLSFKFDKEQTDYFFKDLAVEFSPHQVHFIRGDNGIGKSTFFSIIQGDTKGGSLLEASIFLDGLVYESRNNSLPRTFTDQIHTVQQDYSRMIADQFTFLENVRLAQMSRYPTLRPLPEAYLLDIANRLDIEMAKPASLLSGGQRQVLAILMALQKPTKLLLLDEPTATLDAKNAELVMDILYTLAEKLQVTMVVICHDKELVARYDHDSYYVIEQNEKGERVIGQPTLYKSRI